MNGAQYTLAFLEKQDCKRIFGYPGGAVMPLYDAMLESGIEHYLTRHEQGAAFAAIGQARSSNQTAVCLGTSGPGATNLLTAIADAKLDSVPLLVLTGQVPTTAMGSDAFQEVDVLGLSLSITKHSFVVQSVAQLPDILQQAWTLTSEGRPGPVLVDIPKDVLMAELPDEHCHLQEDSKENMNSHLNPLESNNLQEIAIANQLLKNSKSPVLYVGGGVLMAKAQAELNEFVQRSRIPVVSTLKGLGTIDKDYSLNLGMLGMHGLPPANYAVQEADLLIVAGARLDDRATGKLDEFAPNAKLIHIDIDAAEIGKRRTADAAIQADLKQVIAKLSSDLNIGEWQKRCRSQLLEHAKSYEFGAQDNFISGPKLLRQLSNRLNNRDIVCCDVGQHQMWVAQHMQFSSPACHLTSGGLGTMGFGLPAAMGAQLENPQNKVVAVCGDGSFMMNIQELATLNRYQIPVKILIMDNQRLGMVKQWQELFNEERYSETDLSDNPEFAQVAKAFGLQAQVLSKVAEVEKSLDWFLNNPAPCLLHVRLNSQENVWPIVPPNTANHNMMEEHHAISN
ncbi:acetolactate synthase 2 catalytic subunit [Planctobacterium marinum]|uniref:Acetolactate synthase n=1 Tax=Planctobacterium marinum TaxID=1631968 RepID=A0AA48KSR7_9ALTE|nr:acetolactate synthase [Planctobacterium marinum]